MKFKLSMLAALTLVCILAVFKRPERIRPYPYQFTNKDPIELEGPPNVLITGDRLAVKFSEFKDVLQEEISQNLTKPLEIASIASKNEGLHRTLDKIKRIQKLPKIVIYHGGTEEFVEKKYLDKNAVDLLQNIKRYQDSTYQSILYLLPSFSKILYEDTPLIQLDREIIPRETTEDFSVDLTQLEYLLYEIQLEELIRYVRSQNSLLILMTTPINITTPPKSTCSLVENDSTRAKLNAIKRLINVNDYKGAYSKILDAKQMEPGHAEYNYLKGIIEKKLGKMNLAKHSLEKARAFDCRKYRGDPVFNIIIKKYAAKNHLHIFDMEKMVYDQWGKNVLFFDEIYPQDLYYQRSAKTLAKVIKKILKL